MTEPAATGIEARRDPTDPRFDDGLILSVLDDDDEKTGDGGIRCPRCAWRPQASDRWTCACWHSWNTFDTRGRCPDCGKQWLETQCLRCGAWSPHEEWYADSSP